MKSSVRLAAAILFPIVLLSAWFGRTMHTISDGRVVEFKVRGYDPRDLLAGHYVRYQVDFGPQEICPQARDQEECGCLFTPDGDRFSQISHVIPCSTAGDRSCPSFIRGRCAYFGRFEAGIERFYFPEEYSQYLMTVPPDSSIRVNIDGEGRAIVLDFLASGQSIPEYVAEQQLMATASPTPE